MKRIYIAGCYSADNVITVLDNMREGMRLATEVFLLGYSPFVPWFDFHFQLMLRENENLTIQDYYRYSMDWLEVSDAMLLVPGYRKSKGTLSEIKRAKALNIPIFYHIFDLENSELSS